MHILKNNRNAYSLSNIENRKKPLLIFLYYRKAFEYLLINTDLKYYTLNKLFFFFENSVMDIIYSKRFQRVFYAYVCVISGCVLNLPSRESVPNT